MRRPRDPQVDPAAHVARWTATVTAMTVIHVFVGATLVWELESLDPRSNLHSWGDCLWWATTTVTTVGYGEHFPVTIGGRVVAVAIMGGGLVFIGAVAAIVATTLTTHVSERLEAAMNQVEDQMSHVEDQVSHMESHMQRAGARPAAAPDADPARTGAGVLVAARVPVASAGDLEALAWLLTSLGWRPPPHGDEGRWTLGGTGLDLAVRPGDAAVGVGASAAVELGSSDVDAVAAIVHAAPRHGFVDVALTDAPDDLGGEGVVRLVTRDGTGVVVHSTGERRRAGTPFPYPGPGTGAVPGTRRGNW